MPKTPARILARQRERYHSNKSKVLARQRERYHSNRDAILARRRELYTSNKASVLTRQKKRYHLHQDRILARQRELRQLNKVALNAKERFRYKNDVAFATKCRLRQRIRDALHGVGRKAAATEKMLGCTYPTFVTYLESLFTDGMSWDNMHLWHIDHIVPCAAFDLQEAKQQHVCFWYRNLQPMWATDNLSKSDKWCLQDKEELCRAYDSKK